MHSSAIAYVAPYAAGGVFRSFMIVRKQGKDAQLVATSEPVAQRPGILMVDSSTQIRIARPTANLEEVVAFYRNCLGLAVLGHFEEHAGYSGVMLGLPDHRTHLEFTHMVDGSPCKAPTKDNLLVLYISNPEVFRTAVDHLVGKGHLPVEPENPYWKSRSKTFEDPDGWRVVLYLGRAFQTDRGSSFLTS